MPAKTNAKKKKPAKRTKDELEKEGVEKTKHFADTHPLFTHYKNVNGRLKRLIKRDMSRTVTRHTGKAINQATMLFVDLAELILKECEKLNTDKTGKMMKITHNYLRYVFENSPKLKHLGVEAHATISTQPLPTPYKKKAQIKAAAASAARKSKQATEATSKGKAKKA